MIEIEPKTWPDEPPTVNLAPRSVGSLGVLCEVTDRRAILAVAPRAERCARAYGLRDKHTAWCGRCLAGG